MLSAGEGFSPVQLIAIDRDPKALAWWAEAGCYVYTEEHAEDELPLLPYLVAPVDEHWRSTRAGELCPWTTAPHHLLRDKATAYELLAKARPASFMLPARLSRAVVRPRIGAGSRGLSISTDEQLVTQYVHPDHEYVVDFDSLRSLVCPRVTHQLKHGADTTVTLLGPKHKNFSLLAEATLECAELLGIRGVGNVQFIASKGVLYFVEASARISGSSWVNLWVGVNVLLGRNERDPDLVSLSGHTQAGGLPLRPILQLN